MSLQEKFESSSQRVQNLAKRPENDMLLALYALYKQGTEGDVAGDRPGMMDIKGRAKYDAWGKLEGKSKDVAMQDYVDLVEKLEQA